MPKPRLTAAKANLAQLKAHCDQTEQEWKRAKSLLPAKAIADTDYDLAVSNFRTAESNVIAGEAGVRENEASLLIRRPTSSIPSSSRPATA